MSRSLYKGPYINEKILKKVQGKKPADTAVIKVWDRASVISPEMVGFKFGVHNGKTHIEVLVSEEMVGHRLGEFSQTKKFIRHGGKMQKDLEVKKKEAEVAAAKAAKSAGDLDAGMATWQHADEQERLMTVDAANVSMAHEYNGEEYLINLIDTPGHVDFGGNVTRAMRAIDGTFVLIFSV